jgi:Co/Zn/Cd efflux system component
MACCHNPTCSSTAQPDALNSPQWRRALWIALIVNAGFFVAEIVAGAAAGSASLQADALDFFGDAANYAISLGVAGMALTWRASAALAKGGTLIAFALWVLGSTAWHAFHGTLPRADVMGVVGIAALIANGGVAADALPLPHRRREHALRLDLFTQRRHRQCGGAARGFGRVRLWHRLAGCNRRSDHGRAWSPGWMANRQSGTG